MHLLVSVRDAREASAALAGGAHIIDAKEPAHGPLGAVAPGTLREIASAVPADTPLSAALGDGDGDALLAAVAATPVLPGRRGWFLKFALAPTYVAAAGSTVRAAAAMLHGRPDQPRLVLALYADRDLGDVAAWLDLGMQGGAWGVLLDTSRKDGRSLFHAVGADDVAHLALQCGRRKLQLAIAGGLGLEQLGRALGTGAAIVGVRGAVCDGGRGGVLNSARVRALVARLDELSARPASGAPRLSPR